MDCKSKVLVAESRKSLCRTYKRPFIEELVEIDEALKAGQTLEPCSGIHGDCAIAVGALRLANASMRVVLLKSHPDLSRSADVEEFFVFIASTANSAARQAGRTSSCQPPPPLYYREPLPDSAGRGFECHERGYSVRQVRADGRVYGRKLGSYEKRQMSELFA